MEIIISGSVANYSGLSTQQLLEYLKQKTEEFEFYKFQPMSGTTYAASIDWKVVSKTSSVLTIVSFIWMAYNELIKPNKDPESNGGIIIRIENMEINNNFFWIGNQIHSKEELFQQIQNTLEKDKIDSTKTSELIDSLKNSGGWKKVK